MGILSTLNLILAGVFIALSILYILNYLLTKQKKIQLTYSGICILSSLFVLSTTFMHMESDVERYRQLLALVVFTYLMLMESIFLVLYFYNKRRGKVPFYGITIITLVITLVLFVENTSFMFDGQFQIIEFFLLGHQKYYILKGTSSEIYDLSVLVFYGSSVIYFIWMISISNFNKSNLKFQIHIAVLFLFLVSNIYDVLIDVGIIAVSVYTSEYAIIFSILLFNIDLISDLYIGTKNKEELYHVSQNFNRLIKEVKLYVIGFDVHQEINFQNNYSEDVFGSQLLGNDIQTILEEYPEGDGGDLMVYKSKCRPFKYLKCSTITLDINGNLQTYLLGYDITERRREQKKLQETLIELHQLTEELEQENTILKVESQKNKPNELFVGSFASSIEQEVSRIANYKSTVLIEGAKGTGKNYVADMIIEKSNRSGKPSIVYNCHSSIKSIFQSRYYESKSGAEYSNKSILDVANHGTLTLSNIENMSVKDQEYLLDLLKEKENARLQYNIRFIITTTTDLLQLVRKKEFNMELYQYLSIYTIHLPQLKNRLADIPYLTNFFVDQFCRSNNIEPLSISMACIKKLQSYDWPENIKELRYILQKAVLASTGKTLRLKGFEEYMNKKTKHESTYLNLYDHERKYIIEILNLSNWKISGKNSASEILGINEATLRSKMKKLSITKDIKIRSQVE
ncbi:sigma-54 dependent transcriptional regulator [Flammeovirga sp. EKP202]|uniref:sigma-54-dependent transcriptional regulator n=1 Tax=Flammeovirga sp. EKP202 TaxID=2770592 RepID=UPI00165F1FE0|nr:sigma 54-interacting transcriptional regulator [Flammeovirga sp. EKP202]MBD0400039.1 sigma-54-dependent Fis family transcriptional regulator [Flammeovirga sp. EKP202]